MVKGGLISTVMVDTTLEWQKNRFKNYNLLIWIYNLLKMTNSMKLPKVIVLILNYNGKPLLEDAVSSYLQNDYENFEVVVIDNGSVDGSKEFVEQEFPEATVIRLEKNQGYSGGFNYGLDFAFNQQQADYVLITNNDVKVDPGVVTALTQTAMEDKKTGFVTGKAYYFDQPDTLQTVGKYEDAIKWNGEHIGGKEVDAGQFDTKAERFFIDDIFMMVSKDLYQKVGGYDTDFFFQAEEYDWQARGKAAGYKIMYTPDAKLWHKESMTVGKKSAFKAFYDARNPTLVILKHRSPEHFKVYFWHLCRKTAKGFLVSCKQLNFSVGFNKITGFLSAISWGLRQKKFSRRHFF